MKTCPQCAEEVPDGARTCRYCKSDLAGRGRSSGPPPRSNSKIWIIVVAAVGGGGLLVSLVLIALLLPAVQSAREAARRSSCKNNLKQIGLALHNYHDVYKSFPPAYVADASGRPMYSWRVLILPFVDQKPLYDSFDLSKPWDAPENQFVLDSMPAVFRCPSNPQMGNTTSYAAAYGPGCVFEGAEGIQIRDITDGTRNTIMVGEATTAGIPWTSPQDVDVTVNPQMGTGAGFSSQHTGGAHFLLADGSVRFISMNINPQTLQLLYLRNDGQPLGEF